MNDFKIIFSGPLGAGKTTAIGSISDTVPVTSDEVTGDVSRPQQPGTTVAMDYGMLKLGDNEHIHLYGTPGQQAINSMWEILTQGSWGLILLVNNSRPDPFGDMQSFLNSFKPFTHGCKLVIGVTQMDVADKPTIDDYHLQLENSGAKIPIFEVDARNKRDVALLVEALLYSIDPGLDS
jgi:hypothetical protein